MEQVIIELSKILNDAIGKTRDKEVRKKLQNAYEQLQKYKEREHQEIADSQKNATELLSLMD
jgi:hypothetical protein